MLFVSGQLFGQLDSAAIVSVNETTIEITDTLGVIHTDTVIEVQVFINDFDFFGEIIVTAIHVESQYPLQKLKLLKSEIENNNLFNITQNTISIYIPISEVIGDIEIQAIVRNYQGANLPLLFSTYLN